ncbi:proton-conducting transporter transmembrane domain-containing protein [Haloplasma contractile]|uniref:NADHubiquinone oxidoreductase subunit 5 -Multisubunit Na+-H+ antiporter protein n=1 Tax=Haloplasma contractile SSD-17B TaxID=1033810 RepID=U2FEM1_9MOLU|nr:proton-conducting transporter membrane subunit [Haloplasma contractile]ERJ11395.1 NADHubiquinone oxidoreductase subunit 5 -Multisubunit Na+-H+ antiporter protein [Haloplasma contractile SSD-17B]
MITPGFLYLTGALLLFLAINNKIKYIISFLITSGALIVTFYLLPDNRVELNFLAYTLVPFEVNRIRILTGLIFAVGGLATVIYSIKICSRTNLMLIFVFIGSALTVVFSGDLFTLYVFWELMTISSSILIITSSNLTKRVGYYYFLMHVTGGLSLLWGIFLQYSATGSLSLNAIEAGIPFFMIAIGIKLAFVGFHTWLPLAYGKVPFYVTVILSIYTTKVGVYVMSRLLSGMTILAYCGLISALFGVVMALRQKQVRKFLSYSIIIQVGYMIIGISVGTTTGISGAIFHLVNHILYKTVLFMAVGIVMYTTEEDDHFKNLGIMGRKLPLTSIATLVAFMGIAGVPFFNGYMSKTVIKEAVEDPLLIWGLNLMSFGTSLIFLKFIYYAFFKNSHIKLNKKPAISMQLGLGFLTVIMIAVGIYPHLLEKIINVELAINYFDKKHMLSGIQPFLWSILTFFLFKKYIVKDYKKKVLNYDLYRMMGNLFVTTGSKLRKLHDGNLNRYLVWATTTLIILLLLLMF